MCSRSLERLNHRPTPDKIGDDFARAGRALALRLITLWYPRNALRKRSRTRDESFGTTARIVAIGQVIVIDDKGREVLTVPLTKAENDY